VVNGTNLLFRASGDAGDHFDNPPRLSNISKSSNSQYMIAYQKDLCLVWFEQDNIGNQDVIFKRISEAFFPRNIDNYWTSRRS
jgi:hypothetical protein